MGIPDYLTCLLRSLYAGQEATEPHMEKQTASKGGKEFVKAVYCHPAYLPYMQSTSRKMPDWKTHKIARRNISDLRCADDTTLMAENKDELNSLLMKVKEESEKGDLKLKKLRSWHPVPSPHGK